VVKQITSRIGAERAFCPLPFTEPRAVSPSTHVKMTDPLRVLVVDDDRLVRAAMVRTLRRVPGITVEDFAEGEDALARLASASFDVAVLDLKMPAMDGVALAEALRARAPSMRLIFVTADPHGDLAQRARELSPSIVLAKPWRPDELATVLRG
jgi:CheY-like chemotaxis protein